MGSCLLELRQSSSCWIDLRRCWHCPIIPIPKSIVRYHCSLVYNPTELWRFTAMIFNSWMGCQRFPALSYHLQPSTIQQKLIDAPPYPAAPVFSPRCELMVLKNPVDICEVLCAMSEKKTFSFQAKSILILPNTTPIKCPHLLKLPGQVQVQVVVGAAVQVAVEWILTQKLQRQTEKTTIDGRNFASRGWYDTCQPSQVVICLDELRISTKTPWEMLSFTPWRIIQPERWSKKSFLGFNSYSWWEKPTQPFPAKSVWKSSEDPWFSPSKLLKSDHSVASIHWRHMKGHTLLWQRCLEHHPFPIRDTNRNGEFHSQCKE